MTEKQNSSSQFSMIWAGAFRPFFLLAAFWVIIALTLWVLFFTQLMPIGNLSSTWHGHEMVYGYFGAVLCGFLLTAAKNWASKPPVSGLRLQALVGLWIFSRVVFFFPPGFLDWLKFVDVITYAALFYYLSGYLTSKEQKKNWIFLFLVALFVLSDILFILSAYYQFIWVSYQTAYWVGLHIANLMIIVMSDRTMPLFIERALNGEKIKKWDVVEKGSLFFPILVFILHFFNIRGPIFSLIAILAGVFNFIRLCGWRIERGLFSRLLWIIYAGYFAMVSGYVWLGLVYYFDRPDLSAVHFFTAGGILLLTYAIMSRIALGHTGRPIQISNAILFGYVALAIGVGLRLLAVFVPVGPAIWVMSLIGVSLSQILYVKEYFMYLISPRADGKPG